MIGFLKFLGILNGAIWFGATVFHLFGESPALTSSAMQTLLTDKYFPYYSERVSQIVADRYFYWALACAFLALAHLVAERLYLGRTAQRLGFGLVLALLTLTLCLGLVAQPKIRLWHLRSHAVNYTAPQRAASQSTLRAWQAFAWALQLVLVAGLGVHLWRLANPPEEKRFIGPSQIRY